MPSRAGAPKQRSVPQVDEATAHSAPGSVGSPSSTSWPFISLLLARRPAPCGAPAVLIIVSRSSYRKVRRSASARGDVGGHRSPPQRATRVPGWPASPPAAPRRGHPRGPATGCSALTATTVTNTTPEGERDRGQIRARHRRPCRERSANGIVAIEYVGDRDGA